MQIKKVPLPNLVYRKLYKLKDLQGFEDKSLADYLKWLTRDVSLTPTVAEQCQTTTRRSLLDMWMQNFADNLPFIRFGDDIILQIDKAACAHSISELAEPAPFIIEETMEFKVKGSAVVIGRGPDVFTHKHVEMLADAVNSGQYKGLICSTDGMVIECLKRDLIPDVALTVDGSDIIKKWYDHPLVEKYGSKIKLIFLVTVNHEVYQIAKKNGCKIYWALPLWDDWRQDESYTKIHRLMTATPKNPKGLCAIMTGGNCGAALWAMAVDLFKRAPVALIGYDMGYPEGTNLEETYYFSSMAKDSGLPMSQVIPHGFQTIYHPIYKKNAFVDAVFFHYRDSFIEMQGRVPPWYRANEGTLNCTEGGTLFGEGITCTTLKSFLDKHRE